MNTSSLNMILRAVMSTIFGSVIIVALFFVSAMYAEAAVQVSFRGEPSTLEKGQYVSLVWGATNATECSAGGGWSGAYRTAGTMSIWVDKTTVFGISCAGADGSIDSKNITITVGGSELPSPSLAVNITASKNNITRGETVLLSWSSVSAQTCFASNGWNGTKNISGQEYVAPTVDTTYAIACTSGFASVSDAELIQVKAVVVPVPPPLSLLPLTVACVTSSNPVKLNQQVTFAAGSTGGTAPITYEWNGAFFGSGLSRNISFSSTGIKAVTVTATDVAGKKSASSCSVEVVPLPASPPPAPKPIVVAPPPPPAPIVAEAEDDDARCIARGYVKKDSHIAEENNGDEAETKNERSRLAALVLGEYIPLWLLFILYLLAVGGIVAAIVLMIRKRSKKEKQKIK